MLKLNNPVSLFILFYTFNIFLRLTIKDLLESEFLQSERLRVELTRPVSDIVDENLSVLPLRLKGQLTKHSQDEAIEFDYNIDEDEPETLASEMVRHFIIILLHLYFFAKLLFWWKFHFRKTVFLRNFHFAKIPLCETFIFAKQSFCECFAKVSFLGYLSILAEVIHHQTQAV